MFRIPKEAIGRRVDILIQNIPTITIKVTSVSDDAIVGSYSDGEEWNVNPVYIMAWTYAHHREKSDETIAKIKATKASMKVIQD